MIGQGRDSADARAMLGRSSALDPDAMARARALLARPRRPARMWPVLAAAALLAISALGFATAMLLAPPLIVEHVTAQRAAA
jgi:hypothetical protein